MKLTKNKNVSEPFGFEGVKNIIVLGGSGTLTLERKVNESGFYPITGYAPFSLNGDCAYNGSITSQGVGVEYRWSADLEEGEVEIIESRATQL